MIDVSNAEEWDECANVRLSVMNQLKWCSEYAVVFDGQIVGHVNSLLYGIVPVA